MRAGVRLLVWILSLVVMVGLGGLSYFAIQWPPIRNQIKLGLDLKGGVHMVLQGVDSEVGQVTPESLDAAMKVIEKRVNGLGVSEPVIQKDEAKKRIIVELAGETDTERARNLLGTTAVLKFKDPEGNTVLEGKDIAKAGVANQNGQWVVTLQLKGDGPKKFADATTKFQGQQIAIWLDDQLISSPVVQNPILDGQAVITGDFTVESANDLAQQINGGALPIKLELTESRVVSATLGADSLAKSAKAGIIGLAAVFLFMLVIYRLPGMMTNIALMLYIILTVAVLLSIGAVFTLPGLAGLLLSAGMAVDGNIIIFERIREELRKGKGLRSGIDAGFHRAFAAILDGQLTTAIAAVVLWFLGTQAIKGFAITLGIGVLLSLFTSVTVSRWLIKLLVNTGAFDRRLFGVKEEVAAR